MTSGCPCREPRRPTRRNHSRASRASAHHSAKRFGGDGPRPPRQFGQTFRSTVSTRMRHDVHSKLQIIASVESAGGDASPGSQTRPSSSMGACLWTSVSRWAQRKPVIARGRYADTFGHWRAQSIGRRSAICVLTGGLHPQSDRRPRWLAGRTIVTTCACTELPTTPGK